MPLVKTFGKGTQRGTGRNRKEFNLPPITVTSLGVTPSSISSTYGEYSQSRSPIANVILIDSNETNNVPAGAQRLVISFSGQGLLRANKLQFRRLNTTIFDLTVEQTSDLSSTFLDNTANWGRAWYYTNDGRIYFIVSRDGYGYFGGPSLENLVSTSGSTDSDKCTARIFDGFYGGYTDFKFRIHSVPQWSTPGTDQDGQVEAYKYSYLTTSFNITGSTNSGSIQFSEPNGNLDNYQLTLSWTENNPTATISGIEYDYNWISGGVRTFSIYIIDSAVTDFVLQKRRRYSVNEVVGFGPYFDKPTNTGNTIPPDSTYDFGNINAGEDVGTAIDDYVLCPNQGNAPYLSPFLPYTSGYTFTVSSGSIPDGTAFITTDTGWQLTGVPTATSTTTYNWTVKAFNVGYTDLPGWPSSTYWVDTYGSRTQNYQVTVEVPQATYSISRSNSSIGELPGDNTLTYTVNTTLVPSGTTLYFTSTSYSNDVYGSQPWTNDFSSISGNSATFTSGSTSPIAGYFVTAGNQTQFTLTTADDQRTDTETSRAGFESLALEIRTGSTTGPVVATSSGTIISDNSTLSRTAWDIRGAQLQATLSVSARDTNPAGICFNSTGTRMFITGFTNDSVYQYNLSSAWNISSATYAGSASLLYDDASNPVSIGLDSTGTRLYVGYWIGSYAVVDFALGAANSILSGCTAQAAITDGYGVEGIYPYSSSIFYATGSPTSTIRYTQWSLSSGDITTLSGPTYYKDVSSPHYPTGFYVQPGGTKMWNVGSVSSYAGTVYEYSFGTANRISTISATGVTFAAGLSGTVYGLYFSPDGTKMYITSAGSDSVYQYNLV